MMPTTLPVPMEFRLPENWLPAAPPDGVDVSGGAFAAVRPHPDTTSLPTSPSPARSRRLW